MKTFPLKTECSEYREVSMEVSAYQADGSPAILLYNREGDLIAVPTVCLADGRLGENESYIDTNNCPWAMELIREKRLGTPTGRTGSSGYCTYPAVRFDMERLSEFDAGGQEKTPEENKGIRKTDNEGGEHDKSR